MGAFAIFAFVLTIAYIIYYAVVIYLDLTHKEVQKTDVEDIDIPGQVANVPDDKPTEVEETEGGGYKVNNPEEEPVASNNNDGSGGQSNEREVTTQEQKSDSSAQKGRAENGQEVPTANTSEAVKQKLESLLKPVKVDSEAVFESNEMLSIMHNGGVTPAGKQISVTQIRL